MTRLLPGPGGADSPLLDTAVPGDRWNAWLRIGEDRYRGRRTPIEVLAVATGAELSASSWPRWWDRRHPTGVLTHRAALVRVDGGGVTVASRCGWSAPWDGLDTVWTFDPDEPRDPLRTYCVHCAPTTTSPPTAHGATAVGAAP